MTTNELAIKTFVPNDLILRTPDHEPLSIEAIKRTIVETLLDLQTRFAAHFSASPIAYIGVTIEKTGGKIRLVPSVNGMGKSDLKAEFTGLIEQKTEIAVGRHTTANPALESATSADECMQLLAEYSTLKVESIGARGTNWDTGYSIEIVELPTNEIRTILQQHVTIVNSDSNNETRSTGYTLTTRSEVKRFMEACGIGHLFNKAVQQVKRFEDEHNLKARQDANGGKLPNYRKNSLTVSIPLANRGNQSLTVATNFDRLAA